MKTRTTLAVASLVVLGGIGTAAGWRRPRATRPRRRPRRRPPITQGRVRVREPRADRAGPGRPRHPLLTDRLTLLARARTAAEQAGGRRPCERIDRRTAKLTDRQQQVAERQQKLAAFAAANCRPAADRGRAADRSAEDGGEDLARRSGGATASVSSRSAPRPGPVR